MPEQPASSIDSMSQLAATLPPSNAQQPGTASLDTYRVPPPQHSHSGSISQSKSRRSLASLARERTSTALASLAGFGSTSTPSLRSATSTGSLSNQANSSNPSRPSFSRLPSSPSDLPSTNLAQRRSHVPSAVPESGSVSMSNNDRSHGRMHQTSSKILRMTDDDRPFTKDFKDLFSTLITSLPLTPHRVRFSRVEDTFLSEEAITNLGSLKFSQSNRIPDPKNPSRWVVTTTTTTFSMAKEMARSVCQRFVDARLIESSESKSQTTFVTKGAVWQLTAKGTAILQRFCVRNGIVARHIEHLIKKPQMQIVALERDPETDKLNQEKGIVEIIFRRFVGQEGPNLKSTTSLADSDSISEYSSGLVGVKMARERRILDKTVTNSFTGKAASDWLLDCTTTIDRRETYEMAESFVRYQLIAPVIEDRNYTRLNPMATYFQPTKYAVYTVTEKGQRICGWIGSRPSISSEDSRDRDIKDKKTMPKDSNMSRLQIILQDAALRLLFKEFLRSALCEENLHFYVEVDEFTANYRYLEKNGRLERPESVRETLAAAYGKPTIFYHLM
jgi:GTPase-activating protein SST2